MTNHDRARTAAAALAALALAPTLGACGGGEARSAADTGGDDPRARPPPSDVPTDDTTDDGTDMQIRITIGDQRFTATLADSRAADDLLAQLPVTVDMVDHGGVEKTGPLPAPLSLDGQPDGADPDVGDLGYYAPGNDLVLYHGDQSYFPGIVVLGRLDGDAPERIAALTGPVTATVEAG
ncbi:cyclophilin-like fold protein [Microvirga sp. 0TCS3.31]